MNVENKYDQECFKWSITSALFPEKKGHQRLNNTNSQETRLERGKISNSFGRYRYF